ncbi:bifunctional heparan sulfate N-deacetylase/N-sulfotransferase-like isoform X2 [Lineus longissimus]|uniref:bifunctional heparan sulfate N-deacetylase/N-sulfotransferase-like isoform X2 n=1 Tax=Lineus longissimus TaxID=88925 RepID=UPI00315CD831
MLLKTFGLGSVFARWCHVRQPTITKGILVAIIFSVVSLMFLAHYVSNYHFSTMERKPPEPKIKCRFNPSHHTPFSPKSHSSSANLRYDNRVLVIMETQFSRLGIDVLMLLEANKIRYKRTLARKNLPYLTHMDKGKYGVVVFESLQTYTSMDKWNRDLLDKYCRDYNVGMITFISAKNDSPLALQVKGMPIKLHTNLALRDYQINPESDILRVTRAGEVAYGDLPDDNWTVFATNHSTYEPLAYAKTQSSSSVVHESDILHTVVVQDCGNFDGVRRVLFGNGLRFWLHRLLFLDSLSYLSHGKFSIPLERHILIDIDDIFVGKSGIRLKPDDVEALVSSQERLRRSVEGFTYNLGFSGKYFHHGSTEENLGDDRLLKHRHAFWWFGHMWSHSQAHMSERDRIEEEMIRNKLFAKDNDIPVNQSYAVAPHHSGVFPIHDPLYEAWKKVWGVQVTSTEEYPHLRPARFRRGFIHKSIKVLPRQTCGLFTHNLFLDKYQGGPRKLDMSIRGGELFQTFLNNPINIFMTHMSNYGNDRLAIYTFESVVKFVQCWTNLKLKTIPPLQLARKYFMMYPEEVDPIWQNPCDDKRHMAIWSTNKSCDMLPRFLVIGPQKTGTTALYTFLSMHPAVLSNYKSAETFEEVQFFSGKNYYRGLDWYMRFFPHSKNTTNSYIFEKSANYFDYDLVPMRAHALLPRAKLITILINPSKRAYSWYQHMRAHGDQTALAYNFHDVVTAGDDAPRDLRTLRHRCLNPGYYAQHLERWLDYYSPKQLLILDGELLKSDPVSVMHKVQRFLRIEPYYNYSKYLRYDPKKGFFCQVVNGDHTKCLGRSKGRQYPPIEDRAEKYLKSLYRKANVALSKLLSRLAQAQPEWLQDELAEAL